MGINPLGPFKLLNFKDRVPKSVQKWRLGICLKCEKGRAWHLHRLLLPASQQELDRQRSLPYRQVGCFPPWAFC